MPTLQELEGDKFFSMERAKRGAKKGLEASAALTGVLAAVDVAAAVAMPGHRLHPEVIGGAFLGFSSYFVPAAAFIDGFRPTSRHVKEQVESFIDARESVGRTVANLRALDYGAEFTKLKDRMGLMAHKLLRPSIFQNELDRKKHYLSSGMVLGAACGAVFWGGMREVDFLFNITGKAGQALPIAADHPVEMIIGGAVLLAAKRAYTLAFHGEIKADLPEPEEKFDGEYFGIPGKDC